MKRIIALLTIVLLLASLSMTAMAKSNAVTLSVEPMTLEPNTEKKLVVLGLDAGAKPTYKSSKASVATISKSGLVKAKRPGATTISVYLKGKKTCSYKLQVAYQPSDARYFFYGIGNSNYINVADRLPSSKSAVDQMYDLFNNTASFAGSRVACRRYYDLTAYGITRVLREMATNQNITEKSVTYLYYTGHGMSASSEFSQYRGALCGIGLGNDCVTVNEVQYWLDQVPGKVVVILDSCLSGQFINSKSAESAAASFNNSFISAFSSPQGKALTDSKNAGKYKILTACKPLENSYSLFVSKTSSYSLFTKHLLKALGGSADTNTDKRISLQEAYKYSYKKVNDQVSSHNKNSPKRYRITQHVTVWPANDSTYLFAKD